MPTMQQFYDQLSTEIPKKDAYFAALAQLTKENLSRILELAGGLDWYLWTNIQNPTSLE